MRKKVYARISNDKYKMIVAFADTAEELAQMLGVSRNSIYSAISHKTATYERIEFDDEEEGETK